MHQLWLETPKEQGMLLLLPLQCSMGKAWDGEGTFGDRLRLWQQAQEASTQRRCG